MTWLDPSASPLSFSLRPVLLLALAGGCVGKEGILTEHEESATGGDTGVTGSDTGLTGSDTGLTGSDTGGCVTGCAAEQFPCVGELAWNGSLLGMSSRETPGDCPSCDFNQLVLLTIDPVTAEQTLFAEAEVNSAGNRMALADDGSIFVAGSTDVPVDLKSVALLLKFSSDGELLWQSKPDTSPLFDLVVSGDEVVVVNGVHDLLAFSAADGAVLWDVPAPLGWVRELERDAEGAFYVASANAYPNEGVLPTWSLRKYAADRTLLWEQETPMTEEDRPDIDGLALDEAGGAVVAVRNDPFDESPDEVTIHKIAADGSPLWSQPLPAIVADVDTDDRVREVMARPGGGVIVIGGVWLGDTALAFALDPDGALLWKHVHQPDGFDVASHSAVTMSGDTLLVAGCGRDASSAYVGWLFDPTP